MDTLTIASASAIKQSQIQNQIDYAVIGKVQQAQKQQGDAVVQLIAQAASIPDQIDGGHLDVTL